MIDAIEAAGIDVIRIDIDQRPDLARRYGVTAVPTYFYYECNQTRLRTNQANDVLMRIRASRKAASEPLQKSAPPKPKMVPAPKPSIMPELAPGALEARLAPRVEPTASVIEVPIQVIVADPR